MEAPILKDISHNPLPKYNKFSYKAMQIGLEGVFCKVLTNIIYIEEI